MSLRPTTLIWMLFLASGFFGLYMIKYKVQAVKAEVAASERQLLEEKNNLHVLEAEWSYLNRPERLSGLSQKYLQLETMGGRQMARYEQLPMNPMTVIKQAAAKMPSQPVARSAVALASGAGHVR